VEAVCDIVHLGVNSGNQDAAWAAADLLNTLLLPTTGGTSLTSGQALDLLYTAADRNHFRQLHPKPHVASVLGSIVESLRDSNSLDAVSAAQLMPLLQHAVQLDVIDMRSAARSEAAHLLLLQLNADTCKFATRVSALAQQPAFKQLKPEQLAALLEMVVGANDEFNFFWLINRSPFGAVVQDNEHPAFKQLDAATVAALMLAVKVAGQGQMTSPFCLILNALWVSQAGRQLREHGCQPALPVLLAAFSACSAAACGEAVFKRMVDLARNSAGSTVMLELLTAALQAGDQPAFEYLWSKWQGARASLNAIDLRQLRCIALESGERMFDAVTRLLREHHA
jgi:hypothetical protein